MRDILLLIVVALVAAAVVFGVAAIITGGDRGMADPEPDDRHRHLPGDRPLVEPDLANVRFDTVLRGYRMSEVDEAMRRVGYDIGYKQELIVTLEAEVNALRAGRDEEADLLRARRHAALHPEQAAQAELAGQGEQVEPPEPPEPGLPATAVPVAEPEDAAALGEAEDTAASDGASAVDGADETVTPRR